MDEKMQSNKYTVSIETEGDSILDFKSPEFAKPNIKLRKKEKLKNVRKNQKDMKFKHSDKRKKLQESQPSIESSFFKPKKDNDDKDQTDDVKVALLCPLCLKIFKDVDSQAVHMKVCACKNNISTKKLLDAIELQKRQEDERKSLGLLAAPVIQEKKKPVSRKTNLDNDSDLQLALALSKSLQEAEVLEEVNEIEQLSEVPNKTTLEITESISKCQLEKFGFANNKSATLTRNRKRKFNEITVLQTRTQEERNRILTEKIAEILMGDEPFTQELKVYNEKNTAKSILKSHLLQQLCYKDEKLWNKAGLSSNQISFYVSNLSEYIFPQTKQIKEDECKEGDKDLCQNKTEGNANKEIFYEVSQSDLHLPNEECENLDGEQYIDTSATNWRNALNDSSASDIIIFVNNNRYIWAHKLVFYVQCSNILLDVMPNDNSQFATIKEKIFWPDITYNVALAFLEFIYCGNIKKYCDVFQDIPSYSILRNLARKYKVKELFPYLQRKEIETKQIRVQTKDTKNMELDKTLIVKEIDNLEEPLNISKVFTCENKEELILHEGEVLNENVCKEQRNQRVVSLSQMSPIRHCNESPDMFDDVNESILNYNEKSISHTVNFSEKQKYNHVDTVNSVNLTTIDTDSNKIEDSVLFKNIEGNINSLSNTPQSSRSKRWSVNHTNFKKTKSNLSLFIENFQMENARSDCDTDSEIMVIPVSPKFKRNPFNIENNNSYQDSLSNEINMAKGKTENKRDILNKFDCSTSSHSHVQTIPKGTDTDVNLTFESMDNLTELLENNKDSSVENSVKNDSINRNITNTNDVVQSCVESPVTETALKDKISDESLNNDITKCNESDSSNESDVYSNNAEESIYTKYRKGHQNNSIAKYRDFIKEYVLKSSVENSSEDDYSEREINVETEDITILSDEDIGCDFTAISEKKKKIVSDLEKFDQSSFESPTNFSKTLDNSIKHQRNTKLHNASKLRSTKSESSIDVKAIKDNLSVSSPDRKVNQMNLMESPVLILSSPEIDFDVSNVGTSKIKVNNDISNPKEFDDYTRIFEKDIYLANVYINNDPADVSKIKGTSLVEPNKKNYERTTTDNNSMTQVEKSLSTQQSIRKFQRKSVSEMSLNINTKSTKNNALQSIVNVDQSLCKCGNKQVSRNIKSPTTLIRDSTTPPPDYDGMKTPELHAELHKYGLKLQKRSRAVKLLTYIYNELHPVIPLTSKKTVSEYVVVNSDDEEPPMKRKNYSKNDNDCNNDYIYELVSSKGGADKSAANIINEERKFDEFETVTTNTALNIKDEFYKLIEDQKELHNNILTYEPLCIESLHSMLKEKGFKCKMNTLMDFLDEQI
ncbi:uncharacterized protein LOC116429893 isoform X2 [Nomia melanderi]|uniref:uncharacterized protein LOC116429893 isoform X2 n=1 Tax=Nomia melanderi TaxID=2448451 RepID=UPI00130471BF|nr:uncharacterized protein LOC116429893 isoform X2 [Nomia melanderi]